MGSTPDIAAPPVEVSAPDAFLLVARQPLGQASSAWRASGSLSAPIDTLEPPLDGTNGEPPERLGLPVSRDVARQRQLRDIRWLMQDQGSQDATDEVAGGHALTGVSAGERDSCPVTKGSRRHPVAGHAHGRGPTVLDARIGKHGEPAAEPSLQHRHGGWAGMKA